MQVFYSCYEEMVEGGDDKMQMPGGIAIRNLGDGSLHISWSTEIRQDQNGGTEAEGKARLL